MADGKTPVIDRLGLTSDRSKSLKLIDGKAKESLMFAVNDLRLLVNEAKSLSDKDLKSKTGLTRSDIVALDQRRARNFKDAQSKFPKGFANGFLYGSDSEAQAARGATRQRFKAELLRAKSPKGFLIRQKLLDLGLCLGSLQTPLQQDLRKWAEILPLSTMILVFKILHSKPEHNFLLVLDQRFCQAWHPFPVTLVAQQ